MTKEEMFEERRKVCRKLCEEIRANDHIKENTPLYKLTLPKGTTYVSGGVYVDVNDVYAPADTEVIFTCSGNLKDDATLTKNEDGSYTYTLGTADATIELIKPSSGGGSSTNDNPVTPNNTDNVNFNGNKEPSEATSAKLDSDFSDTFDATEYSNLTTIKVAENNKNDVEIIGNDNGNKITTGAGNDNVKGGTGNDALYGGNCDNTLNDDAGADTFIYESGDGIQYRKIDVATERLNLHEEITFTFNQIKNSPGATAWGFFSPRKS